MKFRGRPNRHCRKAWKMVIKDIALHLLGTLTPPNRKWFYIHKGN
jgi:hypothetical protein